MNNNYPKRKNKTQSFFFLVCLFLLATVIHPVVAEVSSPTPTIQIDSPQIWGARGATQAVSNNPSQAVKQAQALYQEQKYQAAIPLWQQAVTGFSESGDSLNQAMALSNLSLTHQQLGEWDAAGNAIASSLKLLESGANDSLVLAQTLDIQGKLQRETGNSAEAIESWQQAAKIYRKLDNNSALTQNNLNQTQALQDLGLYPRACKRILSSLSLDNIATCPQLSQLNTEELTSKLKPLTAKPSATQVSALRNLGNLLLILPINTSGN